MDYTISVSVDFSFPDIRHRMLNIVANKWRMWMSLFACISVGLSSLQELPCAPTNIPITGSIVSIGPLVTMRCVKARRALTNSMRSSSNFVNSPAFAQLQKSPFPTLTHEELPRPAFSNTCDEIRSDIHIASTTMPRRSESRSKVAKNEPDDLYGLFIQNVRCGRGRAVTKLTQNSSRVILVGRI